MIEGTPGTPYGHLPVHFNMVEANMRLRYIFILLLNKVSSSFKTDPFTVCFRVVNGAFTVLEDAEIGFVINRIRE